MNKRSNDVVRLPSITVADSVLVLGATMRLTRLITADDLGQWWVKDPLDAWVHGHGKDADLARAVERAQGKGAGLTTVERKELITAQADAEREHKRAVVRMRYHRYLAGLECPHCVGYWVGVGVLGSYVATARSKKARRVWRFVAATLALNTVSVTAGRQIDYWSR